METNSIFILTLADASAELSLVGGKGASLARLAAAGLPVPPGFHITTEAYRRFVVVHGLQAQILAAVSVATPDQPATLEEASSRIADLFAQGAIPDDIAEAIRRAYVGLGGGDGGVAVRSSATAEDLPELSFAGQQETYLNIHGIDAVLGAVKKCWASLWTARAVAYRIKNSIDPNTVALAVVVQEMVNAEAAGILFTANPINGRRDEMLINAAWGLGEATVGGRVSPDTIVADKITGKVKTMEIAEKTIITVMTAAGTEEQPLEDARRKSQVLKPEQVIELVRMARRIEGYYGAPQDIEWCQAKGDFYVVQSRPITALPELPLEWHLSRSHTIAARMSFVEFVPDAVPPLFASLAIPIANQATSKLMAEILGSQVETAYYFEAVNGYVYGCFDSRQMLQYSVGSMLATSKILRYGKAHREEFQANSRAAADKWHQTNLAALPAAALLAGVRELFGTTAYYFTMAQSGPIPQSTWSEILFSRFYNALIKRKSDPAAAAFLLGLENLPLQAEKSLFDLAQWAQGQVDLANYLRRASAQVVWEALQSDPVPAPLAGEFADRFAAYLETFGYVAYDLDFTKPVAADDPVPVLDTLKVYLAGQGCNPHLRLRAQAEQRRQAEQTITRRLDPLRRKWFQKLLKSAQKYAPDRENAIADLGLPYPQIRRLLRELGQRLAASGAIDEPEHIYWLEAKEAESLASALDNKGPLSSHAESVETRKADWQRARQVVPPPVLPEKSWLSRFIKPPKSDGNTLKGSGASAGRVTAPACVLRGPEDFGRMRPGYVLVAVTTTPAWTPLFAMASAVVTDIGGPLSHSSIVAREYGIPAVMATGVATRRIRNGQTVTVDGTLGTVTLG